jgi:hypothetical protein
MPRGLGSAVGDQPVSQRACASSACGFRAGQWPTSVSGAVLAQILRCGGGLKPGDELVAGEHEGASAAAAELVGAELGREFVGLTSLNLEDLFDDGAIDDRGGKTLDLGDHVGQAVKPGELWRQGRTSAGRVSGLCAW